MRCPLLKPVVSFERLLEILTYRIHANGGTCAQIATNQPNLYIVYGGTVTREFYFRLASHRSLLTLFRGLFSHRYSVRFEIVH